MIEGESDRMGISAVRGWGVEVLGDRKTGIVLPLLVPSNTD